MEPRVIQSPPSWHAHKDDPDAWLRAVKAELEHIERTPPRLLARFVVVRD